MQCELKQNFIFVTVKFPCVGPIPKPNMSFFVLSMCAEELISTPKINTFWPYPPPGNEKLPLLSNPTH